MINLEAVTWFKPSNIELAAYQAYASDVFLAFFGFLSLVEDFPETFS